METSINGTKRRQARMRLAWSACLAWLALSAASAQSGPALIGSIPSDRAGTVSIKDDIALRFSDALDAESLGAGGVTLLGPNGPTSVDVTLDATRSALKVHPKSDLFPGSRYSLFVSNAKTLDGRELPLSTVTFTTETVGAPAVAASIDTNCDNTQTIHGFRFCHVQGSVTDGIFTPGFNNTQGHWRLNTTEPKLVTPDDFPNLPIGGTNLVGQVFRIDDKPVANVTVFIGSVATRTDENGRFALIGVATGHQELRVDGTSANNGGEEYGQFSAAVDLVPGRTNAMSYNMYLPRIAARDKIRLASPTTQETVVSHPAIPGLEIHIPAGAVLRDRNGKVITELAIVPMPVDRSPIPVPDNFGAYFSTQPGGGSIEGLTAASATGMRVVYPNYRNDLKPKQQTGFWYFDAERDGWRVYTTGHVSDDQTVVLPDSPLSALRFMPEGGPNVGVPQNEPPPDCILCQLGDPVAAPTGNFLHVNEDFLIQDTMPLEFKRVYDSGDTQVRSFGRGMMNSFETFIYEPLGRCWDTAFGGTEADLVVGGEGVYSFFAASGNTIWGPPMVHTATPTRFYGATMQIGELAYYPVKLKDGTTYLFNATCPTVLESIVDRFGNAITLSYSAGLLSQLTSPSGRTLTLSYNSNNLVSQVTDNSGRSISYTYTGLNLTTVTYPDNTTEQYGYDANGNMLTVTDRRGNIMVTNQYDANNRVKQQSYPDSTYYQFAYTLNGGGAVTATSITDTRGNVEQLTFDSSLFVLTDTNAYGTPLAQMTTYVRGQNELITSVTDPLSRVTTTSYNASGDVLSRTYLSGTSNAVTYTYTYTADYHEVATVKDPLGHTTTYGYDPNGCLSSIKDALNHTTTIACNGGGLPLTVTDALNHTTTFSYFGNDLHTITDPLSHVTTTNTDTLGRMTSVVDPLGREIRSVYDVDDRVTQTVDALSQVTNYGYDGNSNLTSVIDPNNGQTQYGYDTRNRSNSRTDALNQTESWTYDGEGNVLTYTDRKNQETQYQYDALNRLSLVSYSDGSTITPTFDAGDRMTNIVDSVSGTIVRAYDGMDRLTSEQTPQGTVSYQYDTAGRRSTMNPASQAQIVYTFDNANRLTKIVQSTQTVIIGYDNANRRTSLTLPNGVVATYAYDNANEAMSITYKTSGGTTLGSAAYTYDAAGQRITGTNSFGSDLLPTPNAGTNSFDLNNRQTLWKGFSLGYDANGDPTSNASSSPATTYTFDPRHRLTQIQQGSTTIGSFVYDSFNRRMSKTVSNATTSFLYDGASPVQETQGSTISTILAGLSIDERYSRVESAGTRYFMTDSLGSTIALTDSSQVVQQSYSYEPYGEVSATGLSNNPYEYTGRENDGTGLYYYRARYYSPSLKRFISEDPMGLNAGLNEYSYTLDDPTSFTDPLGLDVDINLFPPSPDPINHPGAYELAKLYPSNPSECTIAGHGTPTSLAGRSPSELKKLMGNFPQCLGKPIRLLACNTGTKPQRGNPFGKDLAKQTGQHVFAPNDWGWLFGDGSYTIGPANPQVDWWTPNAEDEAMKRKPACNCGKFVEFGP